MDPAAREKLVHLVTGLLQQLERGEEPVVRMRFAVAKKYKSVTGGPILTCTRGADRESVLKLSSARNLQTIAALLRVAEILLLRDPHQTLTKRDIYYRDTALFKRQDRVDLIINGLSSTLNVPRDFLGVTSSPKGLLYEYAPSQGLASGPTIIAPPLVAKSCLASGTPGLVVVVVEKEAVFHTLLQTCPLWSQHLPAVALVTGKGYPDHLTLCLVHQLSARSMGPTTMVALVDYDPYGLDIALRYRLGTYATADCEHTRCDRLQLLGIKRGQLDRYRDQTVLDRSRLGLNEMASKRLLGVIARAKSCGWLELAEAADEMRAAGFGTEIESLYEHSTDALIQFMRTELAAHQDHHW